MSHDVKQVYIDDSLLIFAEKQNKKLEKKITILFKAFLFIVLCIGPISLFLSYFSNQTHSEKPALIDRDNNVEYVEPLVNPSINYTYAGDIAEDYAEDLLSFHFLKIDKQIQSRNSYFFQGYFAPLYMEPLIESNSINKIKNQKLIVTATTVRKPRLQGVLLDKGYRTFIFNIPIIQTMYGPSGDPETKSLMLHMRLRQVVRTENINGLVISDLGIRKR
jgi:hypothetical protein